MMRFLAVSLPHPHPYRSPTAGRRAGTRPRACMSLCGCGTGGLQGRRWVRLPTRGPGSLCSEAARLKDSLLSRQGWSRCSDSRGDAWHRLAQVERATWGGHVASLW